MSSGVHLADPLTGHVGVQLGRGDTRMTEQLLDDPQVGTTLEQVRREGMTKRVRAHRERQAGHPRGCLDDRERLLAREPCAAIAEEERPAAPRLDVRDREETRPVLRNPPSEPVEGDLADRHEALLVSLADHPDEAAIGREVFAIEPERLAHPKTRRVQELEQRARPEIRRGLEERLDLGDREGLGQQARLSGQVEMGGDVPADQAVTIGKSVEPADARGTAAE